MPMAEPFDVAAASYDADFTETQLARWLRETVQAHLATAFGPGDHVLELGCGTGEDAIWLAQRGVRVTATDVSQSMLNVAQRKAAAAGLTALIDFAAIDLSSLPVTLHHSSPSHTPPFTLHRRLLQLRSAQLPGRPARCGSGAWQMGATRREGIAGADGALCARGRSAGTWCMGSRDRLSGALDEVLKRTWATVRRSGCGIRLPARWRQSLNRILRCVNW